MILTKSFFLTVSVYFKNSCKSLDFAENYAVYSEAPFALWLTYLLMCMCCSLLQS